MKESEVSDLIHLGINFGFIVFFFGTIYVIVSCIITHYNRRYDDDPHNSDNHVIIAIMERRGIKPSVLRSIPVVEFNSRDFEKGVECVVCLSDLVDGDKARVLPNCSHMFHVECIDMWFGSHNTCPICRKRVGLVQRGTRPDDDKSLTQSSQHHEFPPVVDNANRREADDIP